MNEQFVLFLRRNGLLLVFAGLACAAFIFWNANSDKEESKQSEINWMEESELKEDEGKEVGESPEEPEVTATFKVDVKGSVQKPGVYEFTMGDRVTDVINKAGGLQDGADSRQVNMAQLVEDEMVIYIPKKGEVVESSMQRVPQSNETGGGSEANKKININKATSEELQELPGIGPSKATAIVQKREELGSFKTIEDLKEVTGIGEKTFEKLMESITVK